VIADDHPLYRRALRQALEGLSFPAPGNGPARVEAIETGDVESGLAQIRKLRNIDLILLDLAMPDSLGFGGLLRLIGRFSGIPVVIVSALDDVRTIRRALQLGAAGFIPKSANIDTIREAISAVLAGKTWKPANIDLGTETDTEIADLMRRIKTLTRTQIRVLFLLSEGLSNKQIAEECDVTESTVKGHVTAILKKLGAHSRTHVVVTMSRIRSETILGNNAA
jgi:DNA-binding NarL/FixJ family response regulator